MVVVEEGLDLDSPDAALRYLGNCGDAVFHCEGDHTGILGELFFLGCLSAGSAADAFFYLLDLGFF